MTHTPQTRREANTVVHVSDLHFGRGFQPGPARRLAGHICQIAPDALVVSGDLTMRARASQFAEAAEFLRGFNLPTLIIPGNHDIPVFDLFTRAVRPFRNYRRHAEPLATNPILLEHAALLGINTITRWRHQQGRILSGDLERASAWLDSLPAGPWRVVVVHQQFANLPGNKRPGIYPNAARVLDTLAAHGAHALLHGHIHSAHAWNARDRFAGLARPLAIISAGTPTCARLRGHGRRVFSFNVLEFGPAVFRVRPMEWDYDREDFVPGQATRFGRDFFGELDAPPATAD